jgi:hypothetical protein
MDRLEQLKTLGILSKNRIAAMWVSKQRPNEFKSLDVLLQLDEIYKEQYEHFKKYHGFNHGQILALNHVLNLIYS